MTVTTLILRYSLFAVLATISNLATQRMLLKLGNDEMSFAFALAAGTIVGLFFKYILDKRWIFYDLNNCASDHRRKFSLYSTTGIFTTVIFWGLETIFWVLWQTDGMRELGAIIGLVIGYTVKYKLDRRFVFTDERLASSS